MADQENRGPEFGADDFAVNSMYTDREHAWAIGQLVTEVCERPDAAHWNNNAAFLEHKINAFIETMRNWRGRARCIDIMDAEAILAGDAKVTDLMELTLRAAIGVPVEKWADLVRRKRTQDELRAAEKAGKADAANILIAELAEIMNDLDRLGYPVIARFRSGGRWAEAGAMQALWAHGLTSGPGKPPASLRRISAFEYADVTLKRRGTEDGGGTYGVGVRQHHKAEPDEVEPPRRTLVLSKGDERIEVEIEGVETIRRLRVSGVWRIEWPGAIRSLESTVLDGESGASLGDVGQPGIVFGHYARGEGTVEANEAEEDR